MLSDAGATGVAPADGAVLWEHAWPGAAITQPARVGDGDILFSTVSNAGAASARGASPSTRGPGGWTATERWTSTGLKPYFNDLVVHKGHAFGFDGSILACIDLAGRQAHVEGRALRQRPARAAGRSGPAAGRSPRTANWRWSGQRRISSGRSRDSRRSRARPGTTRSWWATCCWSATARRWRRSGWRWRTLSRLSQPAGLAPRSLRRSASRADGSALPQPVTIRRHVPATSSGRAAVALCLLAAAVEAAQPVSLTNGRVTAQFGDRGLTSLAGPETGQAARFVQDDFAVTVGDRTYASRELPPPARRRREGPRHLHVGRCALPPDGRLRTRAGLAVRQQADLDRRRRRAVPRVRGRRLRLERRRSDRRRLRPEERANQPRDRRLRRLPPIRQRRAACSSSRRTRSSSSAATAQAFSLRYKPDLDWNPADGPFVADRGLLALYTMTGRVLPDRMLAEWRLGPGDATPGMDEAEVEAFTDMVRAFTLAKPARPVNVFVPWCLNDYQIDIAHRRGARRVQARARHGGGARRRLRHLRADQLGPREARGQHRRLELGEPAVGRVRPEDPEERVGPEDRPDPAVGAGDARLRRRRRR